MVPADRDEATIVAPPVLVQVGADPLNLSWKIPLKEYLHLYTGGIYYEFWYECICFS